MSWAPQTTSIYYTVGTPPVVNLTAPEEGDIVSATEAVTFTAEVSDEEDVPTDLTLQWSVGGEAFSEEGAESDGVASFPWDVSDWETGDHTVEVTVTDTDGLYVLTCELPINAPPNAPTVTISPTPPTQTTTSLRPPPAVRPRCVGFCDLRYVWFADGVEVPEVTGAEFPSASTSKHHTYRVEVFASDGLHESAAGTAERTVSNTAPEITDVSITPDAAPTGTELTCTATAEDADGDTVDLTYTWSDGTEGDTTTIGDDAIVGDTITCTATANDGDEGTATDTATATVTNTPPVMSEVTVSPDSGRGRHPHPAAPPPMKTAMPSPTDTPGPPAPRVRATPSRPRNQRHHYPYRHSYGCDRRQHR